MSSAIDSRLCGLIFESSFSMESALLVKTAFVAFAGVACAIFTPRFGGLNRSPRSLAEPLGGRRRSLAFLAVTAGLLTFFLPLVTTDSDVMGRSRWSPWDISWQIYEGNLPRSIPIRVMLVYLILVFALGTLCLSPSRLGLARIAVFGLLASCFWRGDRIDFELLFYGKISYDNSGLIRHVGFVDLTIAFLGALGALLYIAVNEDLDTESSPKKAKIGEAFSGSRETEFLDAEILPPEENDSGGRRPGGDRDDRRSGGQ
jgi:hypothetical protein